MFFSSPITQFNKTNLLSIQVAYFFLSNYQDDWAQFLLHLFSLLQTQNFVSQLTLRRHTTYKSILRNRYFNLTIIYIAALDFLILILILLLPGRNSILCGNVTCKKIPVKPTYSRYIYQIRG